MIQNGTVLIADDDPTIRGLLRRVVAAEGCEVHTVGSGDEAVRALAERDFDLVVSDIDMPGLNGIQLLEVIRRKDLDLPVVLVTGAPRVDTAIAAVEHGATRYLTKPFDVEQLRAVVRRSLQARAFARVRRELVGLAGDDARQIGDLAGLSERFDRAVASIYVQCQPIVRWRTRSVFAYEVLVRSREPLLANPDALFDAAERLDRTSDVGRRVRAYCTEPPPGGALFFVNLHTRDLVDPALYDPDSALALIAGHVVLEVTERARLESVANVASRVQDLRELGFRIAIDDIGAGYAGLTTFATLEPDFMKLDRGLVMDIDRSKTKQKLVGAMVQACKDLGVEVVAEGVETTAERDVVVDLGCDLIQGFLFARPGPAFITPTF